MALNEFGKEKWQSGIQKETALNAGVARNLDLSSFKQYKPFVRLRLENKNTTITLRVAINGVALGDNSITDDFGELISIDLLPSSILEIEPKDNMYIYSIAIKNTDASTNTSNDEIVWQVANF